MKVRHNKTSMHIGPVKKVEGGYIFGAKGMMRSTGFEDAVAFLPNDQYEEVKEDHWQDVTGECEETTDTNSINEKIKPSYEVNGWWIGLTESAHQQGYRLRKVQLRKDDTVIAGTTHESLQWAFLVERKVE